MTNKLVFKEEANQGRKIGQWVICAVFESGFE
jgi:hypothetical protein